MFRLRTYIEEIVKTGSFSQAAANLYISQPSISACVKRLEQKIGEPLFDRSVTPVQLTQCGEAYLRAARQIQLAEEDFSTFLDEYRECGGGKLVIGGSNLNISYILPPLLQRFSARYPDVELELVEGSIDALQQMLWEGSVDLVMDSCDADASRFRTYYYKDENLILAAPPQLSRNLEAYALSYEDIRNNRHRDSAVQPLPLYLLNNVPFISLTPETDTWQRVQTICRESGFEPKIVFSLSQQTTAFNMASAGLGVTFVSDTLIKNANFVSDMKFFKVSDREGHRQIKVFQKLNRYTSYAVKAFLQLLEE